MARGGGRFGDFAADAPTVSSSSVSETSGSELGNLDKLTFKCFSDASIKRTARVAQQCAVSCVLNQSVAGYTELTIGSRQKGKERQDLELAELFSGRPTGPAGDEIISKLVEGDCGKHLRICPWTSRHSPRLTFCGQYQG
jgi:hypothetical protein